MLESPLKNIQDSSGFEALMKTSAGKQIASRIVSLGIELDTLPDPEKIKFVGEFGDGFVKTLNRLVPRNEEVNVEDRRGHFELYVIAVMVIFTIFGEFYKLFCICFGILFFSLHLAAVIYLNYLSSTPKCSQIRKKKFRKRN